MHIGYESPKPSETGYFCIYSTKQSAMAVLGRVVVVMYWVYRYVVGGRKVEVSYACIITSIDITI